MLLEQHPECDEDRPREKAEHPDILLKEVEAMIGR
jgi:hypothetical protein